MNDVVKYIQLQKRKLIRPLFIQRTEMSFAGVADWFLLGLFVLPSYFGVRLAFFDLTALRFFEVLLLVGILKSERRKSEFIGLVKKCPHNLWIGAYMVVVIYTNLLNPSINTIFYWITNVILVFYCVAYLIVYEYGVNGFLQKIRRYAWIVCVLSPMELIIGRTPFSVLDTLGKSRITVRFGSARIMGNCSTTNGYAMFLMILLPLMCYDWEKKRIDFGKNKWLLLLIVLNNFLTGCRLTVGTMILSFGLCFIMQNRKKLANSMIFCIIAIPCIAIVLYAFKDINFVQGILRTFFSAVDEVLNTNFAERFGADAELLNASSYYRELLFKNTILGDWLNPWLGRGGNYNFEMFVEGYHIQSGDNYYVVQYIAYAWPGLIAWLAMSASFLIQIIKRWMKKKCILAWVISVSVICYFINLWFLDHLQTFPIMMSVFALIYGIRLGNKECDKKTI